jgi:rhamnose transport system substrate-binding protein
MLKKTLLLGLTLGFTMATALGAYAADKVSIFYIPKNTGNPYFDSIVKGFQDGCAKLGCDFATDAPASADATSQIPYITAQVQRGVSVIAISPNSPDALDQVLDRARQRGILVLAVNGDIVGNESHRDASILPVDFANVVGPGEVELLGSEIGYKGDIAILSATTDAPDQNTMIAGMKKTLAEPKYAGMNLLTIAYGNDDPQKSTTEMEALIQKYPTLKGVISPTTVGVAAAAQVLETSGKAKDITLTGLGTPNQMRPFVKDGTVKAFQLWLQYNEGLMSAYFAVGVKNGTIKNEVGTTFNVPGIGTTTIGPNHVMYAQPQLTTFDASNIDQFNF